MNRLATAALALSLCTPALADELTVTLPGDVTVPHGGLPVVSFPGSNNAAVEIPGGGGITLTGYPSGTTVVSFPGTWRPPVTVGWWQPLPRVTLPDGGDLVIELPWGETPPIDLSPASGLTLDPPPYGSHTIWVNERPSTTVAWWGWN